jgi:carbonic anhydrase
VILQIPDTCVISLEESIKEDVALITNDPLFGGHAPPVVGLLYEIETGKLRQVK